MAKTSPRPPWVMISETSCTSGDTYQISPALGACAKATSRCGRDTICGGSERGGGTDDESGFGEWKDLCRRRRWGLGIFVHDRKYGTSCEASRAYSQVEPQKRVTHYDSANDETSPPKYSMANTGIRLSRKSKFGAVGTPGSYCERGCYSTTECRPRTSIFGYRTPLEYKLGYGCERLGYIFEFQENHESPDGDFGFGFSRKKSFIGSYNPGVDVSQSAPTPKQTAAANLAKQKVAHAEVKCPTMDEDAKCRLYTSEFLSNNPCIAFLPWQREKMKKNKKKEKVRKKCVCAAYVNTTPMTNNKFTEIDFLKHDQCTWTDTATAERGEGTEITTCDQFTNVTPEDIDGPPPDYYSLRHSSHFTRKSSSLPVKMSIATSTSSLEKGVPPEPSRPEPSRPKGYHSLVRHDGAEQEGGRPSIGVPASFARMSMGEEEAPSIAWDGIVSHRGEVLYCPPCVNDPCQLGRFWRHTPRFSDVVRISPVCTCCLATPRDPMARCASLAQQNIGTGRESGSIFGSERI
ncbi:hypothetical protein ElyMa_003162500 [Elysia marginata]|uniref:Uncharacterized protein n=1 Tax=Elysia marginata TaxID=1093978 RepID=A0AAV4IVL5_9GAST|nr:hypothetical protein ElyMa_003162500 [Elysia marginata]